jgi:tetratricopeptide (TPR) repeat protein
MHTAKKSSSAAGGDAFDYEPKQLHELWNRLHRGDLEPWPESKSLARLAAHAQEFSDWLQAAGGAAGAAQRLQSAWREFHAGNFSESIKHGATLGALGAVVANKAAAIYSLNSKRGTAQRLELLEAASARAETAVAQLPEHANAHYMLALVLGRYSQGISIIKAVAAGLASRVKHHLERTLALEPRHAEAHVALGLYHAELIGKLGGLAAALTYGASKDKAFEHFKRALKLAPASPIVHIEYANGLLLLDPTHGREQAEELYAEAAALKPIDAMEQLDVARAQRGLQ